MKRFVLVMLLTALPELARAQLLGAPNYYQDGTNVFVAAARFTLVDNQVENEDAKSALSVRLGYLKGFRISPSWETDLGLSYAAQDGFGLLDLSQHILFRTKSTRNGFFKQGIGAHFIGLSDSVNKVSSFDRLGGLGLTIGFGWKKWNTIFETGALMNTKTVNSKNYYNRLLTGFSMDSTENSPIFITLEIFSLRFHSAWTGSSTDIDVLSLGATFCFY